MKKITQILLPVLIAIIFISCDLFTPKAKNTLNISVAMPTSKDINQRGLLDDANVNSVKARFFYTTNGELIEDGEISLTKKDDHWEGSITYDPNTILGNVDIHAMGFSGADGTGEILYQGTAENQDLDNVGVSVSISTIDHYNKGDRGPSGGWVFYDKGSYDNADGKMDKNWRYLEIAHNDLEEAWSDEEQIDTANYFISVTKKNGKVYLKEVNSSEDDEFIALDTTDFYWGYTGNLNTTQPLKDGYNNTYEHLVDGVSTATPKIFKAIGRKDNDATDNAENLRRDTVTILKTKTINTYNDWFIPSKDELEYIYDNTANIPASNYGLSGRYWTSSEDTDNQNKITIDTTITSQLNESEIQAFGVDDNWAWSVDFDNSTKNDAITISERFQTYKVRPARAF